jgi:signal transduction histidine kinase
VDRHGGRIGVADAEAGGAVFRVELPASGVVAP